MSVNKYGVKVTRTLSFEGWNWDADLPPEAVNKLCQDAAELALSEVIGELTLGIGIDDDDESIVIDSTVLLGDEEMILSRSLDASLDEFVSDRANRDGSPLKDGREAEEVRALINILEKTIEKARSILPTPTEG